MKFAVITRNVGILNTVVLDYLDDEHVLSEVIPMFEDDAYWRVGWSFRMYAGELKPERLFLWCQHFTFSELWGQVELKGRKI